MKARFAALLGLSVASVAHVADVRAEQASPTAGSSYLAKVDPGAFHESAARAFEGWGDGKPIRRTDDHARRRQVQHLPIDRSASLRRGHHPAVELCALLSRCAGRHGAGPLPDGDPLRTSAVAGTMLSSRKWSGRINLAPIVLRARADKARDGGMRVLGLFAASVLACWAVAAPAQTFGPPIAGLCLLSRTGAISASRAGQSMQVQLRQMQASLSNDLARQRATLDQQRRTLETRRRRYRADRISTPASRAQPAGAGAGPAAKCAVHRRADAWTATARPGAQRSAWPGRHARGLQRGAGPRP